MGEQKAEVSGSAGNIIQAGRDVVIYNGVEVSIPDQKAVDLHRAALRDKLEAEADKRWGGMGAYIHEEGTRLPIEASPYQVGVTGSRENLLERMRGADRLLVLGEPGSGKTVSLQRLAWELCNGDEPVVPVIVELLYYDGEPLTEWVRPFLQQTAKLRFDDSRALEAFLKEGSARCHFLFDGLNEVNPKYRDKLKGELVRWTAAYPTHAVVITSRAQDEQWRTLRQKVDEAMVIQPITDGQAEKYLAEELGKEKGRALFRRLDARLRELARRPLLLWLIKEAGAAGESVPGNRGELYERFVSRMLRRDIEERGLHTGIPERIKRRAAAHLACELHRRNTLYCHRDEAADIVGEWLGAQLGGEVVRALARHGLLVEDDRQVRFPHQTLQEHFAAVALGGDVREEQQAGGVDRLVCRLRTFVTGRHEGLAALAADDWWNEVFIQLAGLVDDPAWLARETARVNPWLAWWCIEEGRAVDDETRAAIEARSVNLLKSGRVNDRRRAVQALAEMESDHAVDTLFQAAADDDQEVAGLAAGALVQMGEAVRNRAMALARQPEAALHRAGLAYLSTTLGQPVVYVPPGPFIMGSEERDWEKPQHTLDIPYGYWMGKYPVTVALFREFVKASGHKPKDADSLKGKDDHPVVYVNWHDAMAYCKWLGELSGMRVTLPSEAEWEKAARGTDGRKYPWGGEAPTPELCNFGSNVGGTTPVGSYPDGASVYGAEDMSGNVWEGQGVYGAKIGISLILGIRMTQKTGGKTWVQVPGVFCAAARSAVLLNASAVPTVTGTTRTSSSTSGVFG